MKIECIPHDVLYAVRQNLGNEQSDTAKDVSIEAMPAQELFNRYCNWHGFSDWGNTLWCTVELLKEADDET